MTLVLFACRPLTARMTRKSCGERHAAAIANAPSSTAYGKVTRLIGDAKRCAECPVGAAHLRGEEPALWPDGAPITTSAPLATPGPSTRWTAVHEETMRQPAEPDASGPTDGASSVAPIAIEATPRRRMARQPKLYDHNGKSLSVVDWLAQPEVRRLALTESALRMRLRDGWTIADALTTPPGTPRSSAELDEVAEKHAPTPPKAAGGLTVVLCVDGVQVASGAIDAARWAALVVEMRGEG